MPDIDWRKEIENLGGPPMPEVGADPPTFEVIQVDKPEVSLADMGDFSKLRIDIYFFAATETGKTYTMQKQFLTEYGEVPLKDALAHIKKNKLTKD
jgi:hypothetical protein